jgi:hypothetical protein
MWAPKNSTTQIPFSRRRLITLAHNDQTHKTNNLKQTGNSQISECSLTTDCQLLQNWPNPIIIAMFIPTHWPGNNWMGKQRPSTTHCQLLQIGRIQLSSQCPSQCIGQAIIEWANSGRRQEAYKKRKEITERRSHHQPQKKKPTHSPSQQKLFFVIVLFSNTE